MNPVDTNDSSATGKAYQEDPHFETEITYSSTSPARSTSSINGMQQNSENTDRRVEDVTSKGLGYGVQAKMGGLTLTASGFQAEGINPFFTNNLTEPTLREVDSDGYLLQGSYRFGKNRVALSYGKTKDDGNGLGSAADYETRGVAYFRDINDNLKLVAELNQFEIDGKNNPALDEDTRTFAVGAVLAFLRSCAGRSPTPPAPARTPVDCRRGKPQGFPLRACGCSVGGAGSAATKEGARPVPK